jgi:hypothetical protein
MHESANASKRLAFSTISVYIITARTASDSLWFASADSEASSSRIDLALVRSWLAAGTCSVTGMGEMPVCGGCSCLKNHHFDGKSAYRELCGKGAELFDKEG